MKEFDVHFLITFSDFFGNIEAETPEKAIEQVKSMLENPDSRHLLLSKISYILQTDEELSFTITDVVEL